MLYGIRARDGEVGGGGLGYSMYIHYTDKFVTQEPHNSIINI